MAIATMPSGGPIFRTSNCGRAGNAGELENRVRGVKIESEKHRLEVRRADLSGSRFDDVNLSGADFHNANMSGCSLDDLDMSGWRVRNVNLAGLKVERANMTGATIVDARLDGAT